MTRVVITRRWPGDAEERLAAAHDLWRPAEGEVPSRDELLALLPGCDALLPTVEERIDGELLDAAGPSLRVVATVSVGFDHVDRAACAARGVLLTNTPGVLTDATADMTLALLLAAARRIGEGERLVRAGGGWAWTPTFMLGADLGGETLGLVGLGRIAQAVARRARGFGMEIAYTSPREAPRAITDELGAVRLSLDELLARARFVSLHCPLNDQTRHLIDARALAAMRRDAILVNTSRGPVVDEAALAEALAAGTIAAAGLDVFEDEPVVHPDLLTLPNVVLAPHLGSATLRTRAAMAGLAADNALAVLAGRPPLTPVA